MEREINSTTTSPKKETQSLKANRLRSSQAEQILILKKCNLQGRGNEVTELCQEKEMESLKKLLVQESHYLEQEEASSEANDQVNTQMKS